MTGAKRACSVMPSALACSLVEEQSGLWTEVLGKQEALTPLWKEINND